VEGLDGFHDITAYESSETIPGLIVYRFDAQLFFANALYFRERVDALIVDAEVPVQGFVLDAEAIPSMDTTAAEMLDGLLGELARRRIIFGIARANAPLRATLVRTGLSVRIPAEWMFPSVRTAVDAFRQNLDRVTSDSAVVTPPRTRVDDPYNQNRPA
jgi:SulP family sulfate permease